MMDEVTQLLSNKNLKETLGKNKLELNKLLEEFYSFVFLSWRFWSLSGYNQNSSDQNFRPLFNSKLSYL